MSRARLSALDASFLAVETPTAHMHAGWVAVFSVPAREPLPSFEQLRGHIERRLARAPRYRQKLASVPLGLHAPEWIDDEAFSVDRHVYRAPGPLHELVDEVLSMPLRRDRPLWEMWVCEEPRERRFAIVGKTHHCMVDGVAAVELGSMLLDPTPARAPSERGPPGRAHANANHNGAAAKCAATDPKGWRPQPAPSTELLLVRGIRDLLGEQLGLLRGPLRAVRAPTNALNETVTGVARVTRALSHSLRAAPASALNEPLSPLRRLAWTERPLADLRAVKRRYGTTVNDVVLAAVAGGVRSYLMRRGEQPVVALKAMVPVSVRGSDDVLGNHLSFVFAELPCDEPDALDRLRRVQATMGARKRDGEPQGADLALKAAQHTPGVVQHAISRIVASPRTFNLVVSNIPGPPERMYMLGCALEAAYPVVPLADRHAVSVGMTTIGGRACFGVYADREAVPDAGSLAGDIDGALSELLERASSEPAPR
jgi:diacylglycerol O-acyltransferase